MGSVGDNSMIEAFWSRMQVELLDRKRWRTRLELANAIFDYLEIWHNRRRRHISLGMLTPIEFETRTPATPWLTVMPRPRTSSARTRREP
jgi:putative transposase